jgi:hypothetical protein
MRELGTIIGGMGLLIFVYLIFSNAGAASTVAQGLTASAVDTISVLQGKSTSVSFPTGS